MSGRLLKLSERVSCLRGTSWGWLQEIATWAFGDWVFGQEEDWFSNVTRMRQTGFQGMQIDSGDMFLKQFQELRAEKIIP